jgi:citrate lyase beta subunit
MAAAILRSLQDRDLSAYRAAECALCAVSRCDGLRSESERMAALGYNGKASAPPNQVAIVNEVFSPTASTIDWARRVTRARLESQGGVVLLDGKLLDAPVYLHTGRILTQAGIEI